MYFFKLRPAARSKRILLREYEHLIGYITTIITPWLNAGRVNWSMMITNFGTSKSPDSRDIRGGIPFFLWNLIYIQNVFIICPEVSMTVFIKKKLVIYNTYRTIDETYKPVKSIPKLMESNSIVYKILTSGDIDTC